MKEWGASEVVGVDMSDEAISSAKRNFSRAGVNYVQGDACIASQLLMGKKFDVIVSFETVEHLADPRKFLSEIRNLCEENASIFISCPNDHIALPADQSNPYHLRKYRFEEFVSETEEILGKASQWHLGVNVQGYAIIPSDEPLLADEWTELKSLTKVKPIAVAQLLPSQINIRPNKSNVLYYIGVWGVNSKLSAVAVTSQSYSAFVEPWKALEWQKREIDRLNSIKSRAGDINEVN
jgi:SAM-dependent methyltransferase